MYHPQLFTQFLSQPSAKSKVSYDKVVVSKLPTLISLAYEELEWPQERDPNDIN